MKTGNDLIEFARTLNGRPYVFGIQVPKNDSRWTGGFDCAEYAAYCNFQVFGILYGCNTFNVNKAGSADAYTGLFGDDAKSKGIIISVPEAIQTVGAMLLRLPAPGAIGHIVFSQGDGKTLEAHSTATGCGEWGTSGRRFDMGILLPGVTYNQNAVVNSAPPKVVYRLKKPFMYDEYIGKIQNALAIPVDNMFGPVTNAAVVKFQRAEGLIVDGEIMPGGQTAKALGII